MLLTLSSHLQMQRIEALDREIRQMHRSNAQKENLRRHIEQLYQHVHEAEHSIENGYDE